jgi:carbonic anhydrase/acetyltransferase-like protein (isoleucine patch superfamily)
VWGGDPARQIATLDAGKRAMMAINIEHYVEYGRAFARAARDHLGRAST